MGPFAWLWKSYSRMVCGEMLRDIVPTRRYGLMPCVAPSMYSRGMQLVASLSTRSEASALVAPRFPILSLDERRLTPALEYIFDASWLLPGASIVSILRKLARANGLPGHALVRLMGAGVDPYEGVEPLRDVVDLVHPRRMLPLPAKIIRASLFDAGQRGRYHPVFRHCGQRTLFGHHSVTYRCPVKAAVPITSTTSRRDANIAGRKRPTAQRKSRRLAVSLCSMQRTLLEPIPASFGESIGGAQGPSHRHRSPLPQSHGRQVLP